MHRNGFFCFGIDFFTKISLDNLDEMLYNVSL